MNKSELIKALADGTGSSAKDSKDFLECFVTTVTESLAAGEEVSILGFGSFKVKSRPERMARNPQTGAQIRVAASRKPEFKAGAALKKAVT